MLAADAIAVALRRHNAQRIAILSPYPDWLNEAAVEYWNAQGFNIVQAAQVDIGSQDTYAIYEQHSAVALKLFERFENLEVDWGFGTRIKTYRDVVVRFEIAFSDEAYESTKRELSADAVVLVESDLTTASSARSLI